MEHCFISQKPILDIPGQVDHLQAYLLSQEDYARMPPDASGPCYVQHLAASPWAEIWGSSVRNHFLRTIGLVVLGEVGDHLVLRNPRTQVITVMLTCGASFDLPRLPDLRQAVHAGGWAWITCTMEYNLHDLTPAIAAEIQQSLTTAGDYPLSHLAQHWDVAQSFRQPDVLAHSKLVYDKSLKRYWNATSTSSRCTYPLVVPDEVLALALA